MMPVKRVAVAESAIERKLLNGPLRARLTNSFVHYLATIGSRQFPGMCLHFAKLGPKSNLNGVIWCPTKVVPRKNPSLTVISHGRIFLIGGSSMQQRWQLTTTQVKLSY